jgi:hypothetical protein
MSSAVSDASIRAKLLRTLRTETRCDSGSPTNRSFFSMSHPAGLRLEVTGTRLPVFSGHSNRGQGFLDLAHFVECSFRKAIFSLTHGSHDLVCAKCPKPKQRLGAVKLSAVHNWAGKCLVKILHDFLGHSQKHTLSAAQVPRKFDQGIALNKLLPCRIYQNIAHAIPYLSLIWGSRHRSSSILRASPNGDGSTA